MTPLPDCYYCAKHRTGEDPPPGGWLVADEDYQPHFHAWLYPRAAHEPRRGTAFLDHGFECTGAAAEAAAEAIRSHLAPAAREGRG